MTIAIGMLCGGGIIVAADRKAVLTDGSTRQENKLCMFDGRVIAFAIADASDNANAAKSLVRKLSPHLTSSSARTFIDIETLISSVMSEWHKAFNDPPMTSLIMAIILKGCGSQLYLCQPPNTILPKPEPEGYIAAGIGSSVTDPLAATLFNPYAQGNNPQTVLRQISYLMYRAKKDNAFCGGGTDAVYLDTRNETAVWINASDIRNAERASFQLDIVLNMATMVALSGSGPVLKRNADAVGDVIMQCEKFRSIVFHDLRGNEIGYKIKGSESMTSPF
jgi:20S proteasome alpha/beta subunit